MTQVYRQGDICLVKISSLPKGLKKSASTTLLQTGSGGNPHSFKGGELYPKIEGDFIIGYLKAKKGCKVYHAEHGDTEEGAIRSGSLPAGVYEGRRQSEDTISGLKQVID